LMKAMKVNVDNNNTSGDEGRESSPEGAPTTTVQRDSSPENPPSLSSPLKALGFSPEAIRGSKNNSKMIKLALAKSIDKYKEMRDRLEAVER
jgi:hypothetical protein